MVAVTAEVLLAEAPLVAVAKVEAGWAASGAVAGVDQGCPPVRAAVGWVEVARVAQMAVAGLVAVGLVAACWDSVAETQVASWGEVQAVGWGLAAEEKAEVQAVATVRVPVAEWAGKQAATWAKAAVGKAAATRAGTWRPCMCRP